MEEYSCPNCNETFSDLDALYDHALKVHKGDKITWADFTVDEHHNWIYIDKESKTEYRIKKVDSHIELTISSQLTSNPTGLEVEAKIAACNAHRQRQRIGYERQ